MGGSGITFHYLELLGRVTVVARPIMVNSQVFGGCLFGVSLICVCARRSFQDFSSAGIASFAGWGEGTSANGRWSPCAHCVWEEMAWLKLARHGGLRADLAACCASFAARHGRMACLARLLVRLGACFLDCHCSCWACSRQSRSSSVRSLRAGAPDRVASCLCVRLRRRPPRRWLPRLRTSLRLRLARPLGEARGINASRPRRAA